MRTHVLLLLAVCCAAAASLAAAPATSTTSGVVAEDPCGPGVDAAEVTADGHDVCLVSASVTTGGTAPVLELELELAGEVTVGSRYATGVWIGDCLVQFQHEDDLAAAGQVLVYDTDLVGGCGASTVSCTAWSDSPPTTFDCRRHFESGTWSQVVDPPVVDGDTITFRTPLDGAFADVGGLLVPGAVVTHDVTLAGLDVPFFTGGSPVFVTTCPQDPCSEVGGDRVESDGSLTLRQG